MDATVGPHVPVLETPRLRLRGHRLDDFERSFALWGDPQVVRYISGRPATREEVWARLLRYAGHWLWMKYGFWLVEEKATGAFVGEVGYAEQMREITPSLIGMPEMGWVLLPVFQGRGYAFEAVRAGQEWFANNFPAKRTCCIIDAANSPSIRLADKCGFREWQRTTYHSDNHKDPIIVFVHPELPPQ
jgi:RimJ/RimL family protein N-acetyltransferase